MTITEKRELWYTLITTAFSNGAVLSADEKQFFRDKANKMTEAELDQDIIDLKAGAEELGRQL